MSFCGCTPTVTLPPVCDDCIRAANIIIGAVDGPTCNETIQVNLAEHYDLEACGGNYTLEIFKGNSIFDSYSITGDILTIEVGCDYELNVGYDLLIKASCDGTIYASIGTVTVFYRNLCAGVICHDECEVCNPKTGICECLNAPQEVTDNGGVFVMGTETNDIKIS